jgi:hypothetical protein
MCIIAAKYFHDIGWVGVKNRDRNYVPELSFLLLTNTEPHRLLMKDDMTGYMEGLNLSGVCVLSASLMVMDDEKEIKKRTTEDSPDGLRIEEALKLRDFDSIVQKLVKEGMTGSTIVFNRDRCVLIEGCNRDDVYHSKVVEIPAGQVVARTNHGVLLPWAGYQMGVNAAQDLSRKSSESRLRYAYQALAKAQTPNELLNELAQTPEKNKQMNPLRTTTDRKMMRTTAQEMIIPMDQTFYLRPIQSKLDIDFWKINQNKDDLWVEILSNRELMFPNTQDPEIEEQINPLADIGKKYSGLTQPKQANILQDTYSKYGNLAR